MAYFPGYGRNLAGAFGVYLGKAVDLIWETIASAGDGANADNTWVETAYPERSPNGSYRTVRAVGQRLARRRTPNPRVQRTRSLASLGSSPLTRHPLGAG